MIEIAKLFNVEGCTRRDIVTRLMATNESFKRLIFADALAQFRYYEMNGLIERKNGCLVIYHDPN